ncbi:MAG: hypothetical protein WDN75_17825 [Bacteroidota bacterium]
MAIFFCDERVAIERNFVDTNAVFPFGNEVKIFCGGIAHQSLAVTDAVFQLYHERIKFSDLFRLIECRFFEPIDILVGMACYIVADVADVEVGYVFFRPWANGNIFPITVLDFEKFKKPFWY